MCCRLRLLYDRKKRFDPTVERSGDCRSGPIRHEKCACEESSFDGNGRASHNLRSVLSAVEHIVRYSGIGYKEVVISTVGDRRLFEALLKSEIKPALAISLHSAMDEKRRSLLPRGRRFNRERNF